MRGRLKRHHNYYLYLFGVHISGTSAIFVKNNEHRSSCPFEVNISQISAIFLGDENIGDIGDIRDKYLA